MSKATLLILFAFILSTSKLHAQSVDDLWWIAGYWTGKSGSVSMEELWTTPNGGMMLGVHRDVSDNGKRSFEYMRIIQNSEGIALIPSPGGKESVPFYLASSNEFYASFENLNHDFPQRIIYERKNDILLVSIQDQSGESKISWEWTLTTFNSN